MATMSEERRREMEEEMNRFEQEIAAPAIAAAAAPLPAPPPPPPGLSAVASTCASAVVPTSSISCAPPTASTAPPASSVIPRAPVPSSSAPPKPPALPAPPPPPTMPTAPSSIAVVAAPAPPPPPPQVVSVPAVVSTPSATLAPPPPPPPPPQPQAMTIPSPVRETATTTVRVVGRLSPERPIRILVPHHIPQVRLPPMQPMQPHPPPPPLMPNHIQFIPHQLHRQHMPMHRPPLRAVFGSMRGPGPSLPPGVMRPFPIQTSHGPSAHHPGVHVATVGMGMHGPGFVPQVAQINPSLSLPHIVQQRYVPAMASPVFTNAVPNRTVTETCISAPEIAPSPAVYAAPPMKSQMDKEMEQLAAANGDSFANIISKATAAYAIQKLEKSVRENEEKLANAQLAAQAAAVEEVVTKKKEKKKKIIRVAGGQTWEDNSLQEWDPDDFRIFCGDLGNDVTDEVLTRAFSKYSSFIKSKVIRDKRTNKTKGFGFVSFKDPQDFIKAMKEMNGHYVGSRPIKLRKSTWKDRNIEVVRKKQKEKEKLALL